MIEAAIQKKEFQGLTKRREEGMTKRKMGFENWSRKQEGTIQNIMLAL